MTLRDVDALLGEQVLGLRMVDSLKSLYVDGRGQVLFLPLFTGSMGLIWPIVEKLEPEGFQLQLSRLEGGWEAEFESAVASGRAHNCSTAQLAIGIAALAVHGIVVEMERLRWSPEPSALGLSE